MIGRAPSSIDAEVDSIKANVEQLWAIVNDHSKRFDTLQTVWWRRLWFRIDGWPGQRDLNGTRRRRPWHRRRDVD